MAALWLISYQTLKLTPNYHVQQKQWAAAQFTQTEAECQTAENTTVGARVTFETRKLERQYLCILRKSVPAVPSSCTYVSYSETMHKSLPSRREDYHKFIYDRLQFLFISNIKPIKPESAVTTLGYFDYRWGLQAFWCPTCLIRSDGTECLLCLKQQYVTEDPLLKFQSDQSEKATVAVFPTLRLV